MSSHDINFHHTPYHILAWILGQLGALYATIRTQVHLTSSGALCNTLISCMDFAIFLSIGSYNHCLCVTFKILVKGSGSV